ncbi:SDR family NAD(P)-dependent oxidoreductase [Roseateles violae]|uniref:SDR family NAD(P)-dependent oxidoreductase n=1 Tax=Roseateles violae TaxID=3058042 RepID=A0ABT8DWI7_9BURK|nr:SDR family NAD(P)-dependent oxidoreductase [Pelomonas sp. PFR6]MDN3922353.1 SDR family NAD(P)-dependent oxidoreductase [Pelomonas sp. PFR6]
MSSDQEQAGSAALAVVTGASSGIGLELARLCARHGCELVLAADQGDLDAVARTLGLQGRQVRTVRADLATAAGVDQLIAAVAGRPVEYLLANAGHGLGQAFLDQDFAAVRHVIDTNITGTLDLIQRLGRGMRERGRGRILITGSIAGLMPGSFQAVYNGSKAFIDSFSHALRNELAHSGVTVTVLMPGPTDTHFFARAGLEDTNVGADDDKAAPADVARAGFEAMLGGEADVVAGWKNKLQAMLAHITPDELLAERHRKMAEPGTAEPEQRKQAERADKAEPPPFD